MKHAFDQHPAEAQTSRPPVIAGAINAISRRAILAAAESELLRAFVRRHGMRFGASRFVGETFESAGAGAVGRTSGARRYTTLLGEGVRSRGDAAVVEDNKRVRSMVSAARACA